MSVKTKTCKSCQTEVEGKAKVCPSCGAKMKMGLGKKLLIGVAVLVVLGWMIPNGKSTPTTTTAAAAVEKTPEQIAADKVVAEAKAKQDAADKVIADAKAVEDKKVADAKAAAAKEAVKPKHIAYKDLARKPDEYQGTNVIFTGEVIQVQEDGKYVGLRVNVTKNSYGYEDTMFVQYDKSLVSGRVLDKDVITFSGMSMGLLTYKTVLGAELSIPQVLATDVKLK